MILRFSKRGISYRNLCSLPALYHYHLSHVYRYRTYVTQTMPIIQTFEKRGLVRTISAVPGPEKASSYNVHMYAFAS